MSDDKHPVDDLFGEEDLGGLDDRAEAGPEPERRRRGLKLPGSRPVMIGLVVIGVLLFWFLSSRQHERYFLEVKGEMVVVERGWYFPFGRSRHTANRAYQPFRLPPGVEPAKTGAMTAEELDDALLELFLAVAKRELQELQTGNADVAEDMLLRANKLATISVAAEHRLIEMLGDVAFRRGLTEVRGIQARFDEALKQFRLAAMRGGQAYRGAEKWVEAIGTLREEFRRLSVESGLDPDQILSSPLTLPEGLAPTARPAPGTPPAGKD